MRRTQDHWKRIFKKMSKKKAKNKQMQAREGKDQIKSKSKVIRMKILQLEGLKLPSLKLGPNCILPPKSLLSHPKTQLQLDDPKTFDEAMKSQDVAFWKEAINDEMDSIIGNNTWVLADLPPGQYKPTIRAIIKPGNENKALAAACLHIGKGINQMYNGKSRHLGVRHNMIRELITNRVISIEFVRSQQNLAGHLTKGLARDLVIKMCLEPAEKEDEVVKFLMVNFFEKVLSKSMNKEESPM
ncbi:hypothetical protein Tco_0562179 [Tanacetum coccineum]